MCSEFLMQTPDAPDALFLLGAIEFESGNAAAAEESYRKAIAVRPDFFDALYNLGILLHTTGRSAEACHPLQQAHQVNPAHPGTMKSLAGALKESGDFENALKCYQRLRELEPGDSSLAYDMGFVFIALEKPQEAMRCFEESSRLDPSNPRVHLTIGIISREQGNLDEAGHRFRAALRLEPEYAEAYYSMGLLHQIKSEYDLAVRNLHQAVQLKPSYAEAHYSLGEVNILLGNMDAAEAAYRKASEADSGHVDALISLGATLRAQGRPDEAESCYENALRIAPDNPKLLINMGNILLTQGKFENAVNTFNKAAQLAPDKTFLKLRADTLCPLLPKSEEDIDQIRSRIDRTLDAYKEIKLEFSASDIMWWAAEPPFYLAYHGRNELGIRSKYGDIVSRGIAPALFRKREGKYRLAFFVSANHEGIFLSVMKGIINRLSSEHLEINILCAHAALPVLSNNISNETAKFITVSPRLENAIEEIRNENFDVIFYYEIGTDAVNYFLPFYRLAPVQCAGMGFPITSGIPQMDYMISGDLLEPENAENHYREQLLRTKSPFCYFYKPALPSPLKDREHFGLKKRNHIYLIPQSLFKFHPGWDETLGKILESDPNGIIVIIEDKNPRWKNLLMGRFKVSIPHVSDRIYFKPRMSRQDYLNLIAVSDVVLDPFHYGGGTTSLETLSYGVPIVTLPGEFMRGRYVHGFYKKMGLSGCTANSPDNYVEIANHLGMDRDYRKSMQEEILEKNHVLYEDNEIVEELEKFFIEAAARSRQEQ